MSSNSETSYDKLNKTRKQLSLFYLKNLHSRKFSHSSFYKVMDYLITYSSFPITLYLICITIELLSTLLMLFIYLDNNTLIMNTTSYTYSNAFSKKLSHLPLTTKLKQYIIPYTTFLNLFTKINASLTTYTVFTVVHCFIEIIFIILFLCLLSHSIRNHISGVIISKIIQYKILLSFYITTYIEYSSIFIIFNCFTSSKTNPLLNNISCFQSGKDSTYYYISFFINILTLLLKLSQFIIYSIYYQDFNVYTNKLPWSAPYNKHTLMNNVFKVLLVFCIIFFNYIQIHISIKFVLLLIYCLLCLHMRFKCSFYYNSTVTHVKVLYEGIVIFFIIYAYGYSLLTIIFWNVNHIQSFDFALLGVASLFCGSLYLINIKTYNENKLYNFFCDILSKRSQIRLYDLYIRLCQLEYYVLYSKMNFKFMLKMFEFFTKHYEVCGEQHCFCAEMKSLLLNKEIVFKHNQIGELLITLTQGDFGFAGGNGVNDGVNNNNNNNTGSDDVSVYNLNMRNEQQQQQQNALSKLVEINMKNAFLSKSNDKIFWGRFINKVINNYLIYNKHVEYANASSQGSSSTNNSGSSSSNSGKTSSQHQNNNNNNSNNSSNSSTTSKYLFSLMIINEPYFDLLKLENAFLVMHLLANPIEALIEANLIKITNITLPLVEFIIYTGLNRIFTQCFTAINISRYNTNTTNTSSNPSSLFETASEITGCEIKNILLYNKLWSDQLTAMNATIHYVKHLYAYIKRRTFNIPTIEALCHSIRRYSKLVNEIFSQINSINGLTTTSQDSDYKIFKLYSYYTKKLWKNTDEAELYIKKSLDEIYSTSQIRNNIKAPRFDDNNFLQDLSFITSSFFKINNTGIAILNANLFTDNFGKISYINSVLWKDICEFASEKEILHKNISMLMPDFIGSYHDIYIRNFILTSQSKIINYIRCNFILDKNKLFVPVKFLIKFLPSITKGVNFVGYISKSDFYEHLITRTTKVGYILTDISNKILFYDKNCKNCLGLRSEIIYNITKMPEDDFYLHSLFPELLNTAKLNELKRNNAVNLIYNNYAIKKFVKKHIDDDNDNDALVLPCYNSNSSSKAKMKTHNKHLRVGIVDKTMWNFDTKYQGAIRSFNKNFNIFFILFDKDVNEDGLQILEDMKNKEDKANINNNNNNVDQRDDETENISSMISSINISTTTTHNVTSVNFMLSTIKSSLNTNTYPMLLTLITILISALMLIFISIIITDTVYSIMQFTGVQALVDFTHCIYKANCAFWSIQYKIFMINLELFEYTTHNDNTRYYLQSLSSDIQHTIGALTDIQSEMALHNNNKHIKQIVDYFIREQNLVYTTFLSENTFINTNVTFNRFQLDYSQNIDRVLKFYLDFNSGESMNIFGKERRSNFIRNYNGVHGFGYNDKDVNSQSFIVSTLTYKKNFLNFVMFYNKSFNRVANGKGGSILNEVNTFIMWVTVGVGCFFVGCYVVIFVILYMLEMRIYSIAMLLVNIPYYYIEKCYDDIEELMMNMMRIVEDDKFFIQENIDPNKLGIFKEDNNDYSKYIQKYKENEMKHNNNNDNDIGNVGNNNVNGSGNSNTVGNNTTVSGVNVNANAKEKRTSLLKARFTRRTTKRGINSTNVNNNNNNNNAENGNRYYYVDSTTLCNNNNNNNNNNNYNGPQHNIYAFSYSHEGPKSKNDEQYLKYDAYYQHKQYQHIKRITLKSSINPEILITLLIYCIIYISLYFISKHRINLLKNALPSVYLINNLRYNLPMMLYHTELTTINGEFNYNISFTDLIIYNFTILNNVLLSDESSDNAFKRYYKQIVSSDVKEICTEITRLIEDNKINSDLIYNGLQMRCDTCMMFNNGIEMGSLRVAGIITSKNSMWMSLTEINDDVRDVILNDGSYRVIKEEILFIYLPLVDELMNRCMDTAKGRISMLKKIAFYKGVSLCVVAVISLVLYFVVIQRRYFERFMNNKILVLLIPTEYLKKNKKQLINYI